MALQHETQTRKFESEDADDNPILCSLRWDYTTDPSTGRTKLVPGSVRYANDEDAELMDWYKQAGLERAVLEPIVGHLHCELENMGNDSRNIKDHPDLVISATRKMQEELQMSSSGEGVTSSVNHGPAVPDFSAIPTGSVLATLKDFIDRYDAFTNSLIRTALTTLHAASDVPAFISAGWKLPSADDIVTATEDLGKADLTILCVEKGLCEALGSLDIDHTAGAYAIAMLATVDPEVHIARYGADSEHDQTGSVEG